MYELLICSTRFIITNIKLYISKDVVLTDSRFQVSNNNSYGYKLSSQNKQYNEKDTFISFEKLFLDKIVKARITFHKTIFGIIRH